MAQCMRRPALSAVGIQFRPAIPRRAFSHAPLRWAAPRAISPQMPRPVPERSVTLAAKEFAYLPNDIGLVRGTFIYPYGDRRPSIFKQPRVFARFQWHWFVSKARDLMGLVSYRVLYRKHVRLRRRQIVPSAKALHHQMYTALADGDLSTLRKICADGLYESFAARIAARGKGSRRQRVSWELVKYNKRARIMSHKGASLGPESSGLRQVVVRIASRQKLTRFKPGGGVVEGSGMEKDVVEYLVIQKALVDGEENEKWTVWGTTEDTTPEKLEEERRREYG